MAQGVRLSEAARQDIARLFKEGKLSGNKIAEQLGISRDATQKVIKELRKEVPRSNEQSPPAGSAPAPAAMAPTSELSLVSIRIDPEFQSLIPPLTAEERGLLEERLLADGCRDALVIWRQDDGPPILLDGHNRHAICQAHDLRFDVVEARGIASRDDAKAWIIRTQLARRNLEPYQRASLVLALEPLIAAQAKAQQGRRTDLSQNFGKGGPPVHTDAELGKMVGLSDETIRKARLIEREADEPTKEALRQGQRSIHSVYQGLRRPRAASNGKATAEASSPPTLPSAERGQKKFPLWYRWHERLGELRQHVGQMEQSERIENVARVWDPAELNGYREELGHLIARLQHVSQRIDAVICAKVDGDPQFVMARRIIDLAGAILDELASWRQQFPEDLTVHAFGLMEKKLMRAAELLPNEATEDE
jgi:transposase-like protein